MIFDNRFFDHLCKIVSRERWGDLQRLVDHVKINGPGENLVFTLPESLFDDGHRLWRFHPKLDRLGRSLLEELENHLAIWAKDHQRIYLCLINSIADYIPVYGTVEGDFKVPIQVELRVPVHATWCYIEPYISKYSK